MAEGEFASAKTSVWWDIENCAVPWGFDAHNIAKNISFALANEGYGGMVTSIYAYGDTSKINTSVQHALNSTGVNLNHVPAGFDAHNIAQNITAALANEGYGGMVTSIYAYGDTSKINTSVQLALNSTGVNLNHVPAGAKDAADKKMLVDMLIWAVDNPRPANFLLISGDRDFSNALHQLRMRRYNILLAHAPNMSQALVAAAKCVWLWSSLVAGGPSRNAELSLKSGATDTDSGNSSEGIEQTQNAHGNANPTKASKKSKRPTLGMQDKRNGSPENNNVKANEKQQTDQVSATDQVSEAHGSAQSKNNAGPMTSTSSSTSSEFPSNSGINQVGPGPELRPSEKNPAQPPFVPPGNLRASSSVGNSFFPQPRGTNRPPFENPPQSPQAERLPFCVPSPTLPDISRLNMSEHPIRVQQRPICYQHNPEMMARFSGTPQNSNPAQNFGHFPPVRPEYLVPPAINENTFGAGFSRGQEFPGPTPELQFHIDTILHALDVLRMDKLAPTETNIGDCILFGETKHSNFNVRLGLDYAMRYGMIVKQSLGKFLPLYIPKNDKLWNCVNIMDVNARHPKKTWDTVQKYMSSPIGRAVLLHTKCMYEAAMVLKTYCLKDLPLGTVLQILQLTIVAKKWVVPHSSGWQPIAIYLPLS